MPPEEEVVGKFTIGERAQLNLGGELLWCTIIWHARRYKFSEFDLALTYDVQLVSANPAVNGRRILALEMCLKKPCSQEVVDAARRRRKSGDG